jgi:outer membrane receptor protein involved in Fe transport
MLWQVKWALSSPTLEEVVVTAQLREQNLQDVPTAIHVVSGDSILAANISKMEDLAPRIPSFHIGEAYGNDQFFLRGIGSGVNFGFEQAVGQVIDGFFYGRSRFGRAQFLDIERVEILKGPQGAIIGKNTSAGAIYIRNAKPSQEFESWLSVNHVFNDGEGETLQGAISGPLTETLSARLALHYDNREGYVRNLATGDDNQSIEDISGRLSLLYEASEKFDALFQYAHGDFERFGRNIEVSKCSPGYLAVLYGGATTPEQTGTEDCRINYTRDAMAPRNGVGNFEGQSTQFNTAGLTLNWHAENFTISSLTGYADYEYLDQGVVDHSAVEFINSDIKEDYQQWSQEFRIVSSFGGEIAYIAGIYYQDNKLDSPFDLHISPAGTTRHTTTSQQGETLALFGNLTWYFSPTWSVTIEGRYTQEEKQAQQQQLPYQPIYSTTPYLTGPGFGGPAGAFNVHTVSADRDENNFSPGLILQWLIDDNSMLYASIKRGFKGGGFDHQLNAGTDVPQSEIDERFQFDEENVTAFELGGKWSLVDGALKLNATLFRNEYEDLQLSTQVADLTFAVQNAGEAISQGAELDLSWAISESLFYTLSLAYLDAEYEDFKDAPCYALQTVAEGCSDGDWTGGSQDLSGKDLQYAPSLSFSSSLEYRRPLSDQFEWISALTLYGAGDQHLALDLDPNTREDDYIKADLKLTLKNSQEHWELSLIGKNLGDVTTSNFANDIPGLPNFAGSYFRMVDPPRTVSLQATFRY